MTDRFREPDAEPEYREPDADDIADAMRDLVRLIYQVPRNQWPAVWSVAICAVKDAIDAVEEEMRHIPVEDWGILPQQRSKGDELQKGERK